jgi:hypothetical protein
MRRDTLVITPHHNLVAASGHIDESPDHPPIDRVFAGIDTNVTKQSPYL